MQFMALRKGSRSKLLAVFVLGMMLLFSVRLFQLQILQHDEYVQRSAAEQIRPLTIPAKRGLIYALDGSTPVPLVINQTVYTMFADPVMVTDPDKIVDVINRVAKDNLQPNPEALLSIKNSRYQILGKKLTRRQAEEIKKENLQGVGFQAVTERVYPEGKLAAQTLGFVNAEGLGQYGIEAQYNDALTGKDGLLKSVTDVSGVPLTIGNRNIHKPAKNGDTIVLTIDRNIQSYTEKALVRGLKKAGATNGSVIVIDPQSGKVMAMANFPTYDPANFGHVKSAAVYNNPIIDEPYEPGSDIKTFTVAVGIDKGVILPNSTYNNQDFIKVDDWVIRNATRGHTGNITMQTALNYSLNTGMVTIVERLGDGSHINLQARNTMYGYFHDRFGFGKLTGIELPNEQPGIVIPPTDVQGNAVRYSNMSFGQGMDLTMVQVASAFSTLVNGGVYYTPTIYGGLLHEDGTFMQAPVKQPKTGIITPKTSKLVHKMIHDARAKFYATEDKAGYDIGGKTGTSQTLENGRYVDNQTVATYLGYGGDTMPRYVIMVQASGKGLNLQGNLHALPIFTDISNWLIDYLKLQPKR
ncbi:penicillin-binding protein 2 [Candidatus Saccharibacteria bacterium]|nr:penicillin-binding protein 2 [Candidatus Saccharibacteria bacterium]